LRIGFNPPGFLAIAGSNISGWFGVHHLRAMRRPFKVL
jgi:hypothetical protein